MGENGLDLLLDPLTPRGKGRALESALREAVRSGRLAPGSSLPGSRVLASDLGVARGTIVAVYSQLVAEGWLIGSPGSGTRVAQIVGTSPSATPDRESSAPHGSGSPPDPLAVDLRPGRPDLGSFPRSRWAATTRRVLTTAPTDLLDYADPAGLPGPRATVAAYLARTRGVTASTGTVLMTSGVSHSLAVLGRALVEVGVRRIGVEAPGLGKHRELLRAAGLTLVPLPVGRHGAHPSDLDDHTDAVLLTPSHQHPRGVVLTPAARAAFLLWARRRGGWLIEDDYDGEFRYDHQPVAALQARDHERVAYLGSVSKALAPGLRLGWLVSPPALYSAARTALTLGGAQAPNLDQLVLADLIERGDYDRHVRRMRLAYRRRRAELSAVVAAITPIPLEGVPAGLHALLPLADAEAEAALLRTAARVGVRLHGLHHDGYWPNPDTPEAPAALVIGYATPARHGWASALDRLALVLGDSGAYISHWPEPETTADNQPPAQPR